jgi:hypothetical protein
MSSQIDGRYLLGLAVASNAEISTIVNPIEGSILYNSDEEHIFLNTTSGFSRVLMINTDQTDYWSASGNSNTDETSHFIGTIDLKDLIFKTNNTEHIRITSTGNIGINTTTPQAQLDIESTGIPLRIQPSATTPTGTTDGQLFIGDDGILYAYDNTRAKWLSVDRTLLNWESLLTAANAVYIGASGVRMTRDATITSITVQSGSVLGTDWSIEVRKNGLTGNILNLGISSTQAGNHNNNINIDVNEGDYLRVYCNGLLVVMPQALIEIAWRK